MLLRQQSRMQKPEGFTYSCMEDFLLDRAQLWPVLPTLPESCSGEEGNEA